MNEERLKEIEQEREVLYAQLGKLEDEVYRLENADAFEVAEASLGKFYRKTTGGMSEHALFHVTKVVSRKGYNCDEPSLRGEYVLQSIYLIGDISVYVSNSHPMRIDEFKDDYEEITEEEYNSMKKNMLEMFMPKENCDGCTE